MHGNYLAPAIIKSTLNHSNSKSQVLRRTIATFVGSAILEGCRLVVKVACMLQRFSAKGEAYSSKKQKTGIQNKSTTT